MPGLHHQQLTAVSQSRTSIFQEHLEEDTLMSTHQTDPTIPQSPDASRSLESEGASRRGCGLRPISSFIAKRRKLDECMHSQTQQEPPHQRSFQVIRGRKLNSPTSGSALGSPSTVVFGPASQPRFLEFIPPVKLPGPLLLHPEVTDSGVELPQVVAMLALGEPSSPGRLRRGGNNLKRDHPRNGIHFDSACSCRGDVVGECGIFQQDAGHLVQRDASVHSVAGIIDSAEEHDAPRGIDSTLYSVDSFSTELDHCKGGTPAPEAWWTASDEQPDVATAICFSNSASQRRASNGIENNTAFDQSFRLPSFDFSQSNIPTQRFAQDCHSASTDGEQSSTEWRCSSIHASQEILCRVGADRDVSCLNLDNEARPSETLAQPVCHGLCGSGVQASPCTPFVNFDHDDEPYFPPEWEGKQWLIPRVRPREVYWED